MLSSLSWFAIPSTTISPAGQKLQVCAHSFVIIHSGTNWCDLILHLKLHKWLRTSVVPTTLLLYTEAMPYIQLPLATIYKKMNQKDKNVKIYPCKLEKMSSRLLAKVADLLIQSLMAHVRFNVNKIWLHMHIPFPKDNLYRLFSTANVFF